jgi:flavin reductase
MSVPAPAPPPAGPEPRPVDPDAFRRAAAYFASGVTVVTTLSGGIEHAMTASAFTSVSLDPLLVLVCVEKDARFHDAVLDAGTWAVSMLTADARPAADWFASKGRPLIGQFDRFAHRRGPATGAPLLEDALAWLECRTTAIHDGGDHDIVVGSVVEAVVGNRDAPPLVHYRSHYGTMRLPGDREGSVD